MSWTWSRRSSAVLVRSVSGNGNGNDGRFEVRTVTFSYCDTTAQKHKKKPHVTHERFQQKRKVPILQHISHEQ